MNVAFTAFRLDPNDSEPHTIIAVLIRAWHTAVQLPAERREGFLKRFDDLPALQAWVNRASIPDVVKDHLIVLGESAQQTPNTVHFIDGHFVDLSREQILSLEFDLFTRAYWRDLEH